MSAFVLDASIAAAWCFEDQSTPYTEAVLQSIIAGAEVIVPIIWRQFAITVDLEGLNETFGAVINHARQHQRSAYDASYLELAQHRRLPFATKVEPLRAVANALRIGVFQS